MSGKGFQPLNVEFELSLQFFRWGAKSHEGELIVAALKNAKVVKRISKNPITNYFPKKKKIDKILPPPKIPEHIPENIPEDIPKDIPTHGVQGDVPVMNPDEILNLQSESQEKPTWNDPTDTRTEVDQSHGNESIIKTSSDTKSGSKISDRFKNAVLPDENLNMNIPSSSIIPTDEAMDTDSIKSDDDINALDESIMTAGPGITVEKTQSQNASRNNHALKASQTFDDFSNTSDVDGFSPINSISDEENDITITGNVDFDQTLDQSVSSAPLFCMTSTTSTSENSKRQNHLRDISNRKKEATSHKQNVTENPFSRASIRMRNNLNRAIEDPSSAYNILQTILKSQTDPAFLSKTAKFPSKYNTPFSM